MTAEGQENILLKHLRAITLSHPDSRDTCPNETTSYTQHVCV